VLVCPVMHFLHHGHGGHGDHEPASKPSAGSRPDTSHQP
jgi:hypothetical protein